MYNQSLSREIQACDDASSCFLDLQVMQAAVDSNIMDTFQDCGRESSNPRSPAKGEQLLPQTSGNLENGFFQSNTIETRWLQKRSC
jgi:hypothetical protein